MEQELQEIIRLTKEAVQQNGVWFFIKTVVPALALFGLVGRALYLQRDVKFQEPTLSEKNIDDATDIVLKIMKDWQGQKIHQ